MIFFIKKYYFAFNFLLVASIHNIAVTSQPNLKHALELAQLLPQKKPCSDIPKSERPGLNNLLATSNTAEEVLAQLKKYNYTLEEIYNTCLLKETMHKLTPEIMRQLPKN